MLPHVDAAFQILLLDGLHEALELHSAVTTSIARQHVRNILDMLKISLVLINHSSEKGSQAYRCFTLQHHLVEFGAVFLLQDHAHTAEGLADNACAATTFDVRLLEHDGASHGDRAHKHLLGVTSTLHALLLKFFDQLIHKLGTFLVKAGQECLGIDQALTLDDSCHTVELPLAVMHVFLDASPSWRVRRLNRVRVEANGCFRSINYIQLLLEEVVCAD